MNKNVTREEFFEMADRELARLGKPLHVALKHVVVSNSKLLQTKPERTGERDPPFISSKRVRTENLCFTCQKPGHTRKYCPARQTQRRTPYEDPRPCSYQLRPTPTPSGSEYLRGYNEAIKYQQQQQNNKQPSSLSSSSGSSSQTSSSSNK
jgi:hypothetical protein